MNPPVKALQGADLYHACDPETLSIRTTDDLEDFEGLIGQERAVEAIEFGTNIRRFGYNVFVFGPPGAGKHTLLRHHLKDSAAALPVPDDWCYVNNFSATHKPRAISLPPGRARQLRDDMERLVGDLKAAIPAVFESEEYAGRRQALEDEFKEYQESEFNALRERANEQGVALIHTPQGFALASMENGHVVSPEDFSKWPEDKRKEARTRIQNLEGQLQETMRRVPQWERDHRKKLRELNSEVTRYAIGHYMDELRSRYDSLPQVLTYFEDVEKDLLENYDDFLLAREADSPQMAIAIAVKNQLGGPPSFRRFQVNIIADRTGLDRAPVIHEDMPKHATMFGRIEHLAQFGALTTDFNLIKPGVLHEANGGFVVVDARKLLTQPFVWEELKRALHSREIRIQGLYEAMGLPSTVSLDPEPIRLNVKVLMVGEPMIYYLLSSLDPEFKTLFKVAADFDYDAARSDENTELYARLIGRLARRQELRPFDSAAVARVIEQASRLAADGEKLTLRIGLIDDLLTEADYWAERDSQGVIGVKEVQKAIDAATRRQDRLRERSLEQIRRGDVIIDTDGAVAGQVNALSVVSLGDFSFGKPSRITARVRLGQGKLVDIEREVELGGPLHSKGVLILAGYLGEAYARRFPLSLSASLVFEQSYGGVDGDSASSSELYALISAISGVPIKQCFAVTGSVNQRGQIQPVGGINEKIEGFFDLCRTRGLTGEHGVLIPAANVKHLMLRGEIVEAAGRGEFHVYAIETIDQGIELLTGRPAGKADEEGVFPEGSVNSLVQTQLAEFARLARAAAGSDNNGSEKSLG
jgi:predicted ATP-dependent protease